MSFARSIPPSSAVVTRVTGLLPVSREISQTYHVKLTANESKLHLTSGPLRRVTLHVCVRVETEAVGGLELAQEGFIERHTLNRRIEPI